MSYQITDKVLGQIVMALLRDTQETGELVSYESFQGFMTNIAQVVCDYCGGEIPYSAELYGLDGNWCVEVQDNDSLPSALDNIWQKYEKNCDLFAKGTPEWFEATYGAAHPEWPKADWKYAVSNDDTQLGYWAWVAHNVEHNNQLATVK